MKRIATMAAVAVLALLLALPLGGAAAQDDAAPSVNVPPAFLFGNAMSDGLPVPEGTPIVAMAGEEEVGSAMAMMGGEFELTLMQPSGTDGMVTFMIGDRMAGESYEWMSGGRVIMDLNADLSMSPAAGEGAEGKVGPRGPAGPPGVPGPSGADGRDGVDGRDGADGQDGADGADGQDGVQGVQGPQGEPGNTGPAGPIGPQGGPSPMGIIALIVAIVAAVIGVAAIIMGRRTA